MYFQGPRWPCKSYGWKDSLSIQRGHSRYCSVGQWSRQLVYAAMQNPRQQSNCSRRTSRGYITGIGSHQTCKPVSHASNGVVSSTSLDRVTPTSLDKASSPSIDIRYECRRRAYDSYGAKKFRWEQKDEYGVYRDESGHARSTAGDMILVTKDDIRNIMERASLFGEGHICLPEHATSFTPTTLAPEMYTKDEISEMVSGICGTQEKL